MRPPWYFAPRVRAAAGLARSQRLPDFFSEETSLRGCSCFLFSRRPGREGNLIFPEMTPGKLVPFSAGGSATLVGFSFSSRQILGIVGHRNLSGGSRASGTAPLRAGRRRFSLTFARFQNLLGRIRLTNRRVFSPGRRAVGRELSGAVRRNPYPTGRSLSQDCQRGTLGLGSSERRSRWGERGKRKLFGRADVYSPSGPYISGAGLPSNPSAMELREKKRKNEKVIGKIRERIPKAFGLLRLSF